MGRQKRREIVLSRPLAVNPQITPDLFTTDQHTAVDK